MIYIPITRTRQESVRRFLSAGEAFSLFSFEFLLFFVHGFSLFQLNRIALAILKLVELAILLSPLGIHDLILRKQWAEFCQRK